MKIKFCGAAGTVTGSCHLVTCGSTRFLVDCGMFQGNKTLKERNYGPFAFNPTEIDFVVLTHAHIDHSGLLPKLVKQGFNKPIYTTAPTAELCRYMLPDSAHIQEMEVEQKNRRNERRDGPVLTPIYDINDAEKTIGLLKPVPLNENQQLGEGVRATFRGAGHILGSALIEFELEEGGAKKRVVFTGDIGSPGHPIIEDPETVASADALVIESTYGDRNRDDGTPEARREQFARIINKTCAKGGNLIIPGFAVGRTQDLLLDLLILFEQGTVKNTEIYVDSPLAVQVTQVFSRFPDRYDAEARRLLGGRSQLFDHPRFHFTQTAAESKALNEQRGCVIISASGMCDAGRIKHHLRHNLWRPENCVLFVGYQAEGSLGSLLLQGAEKVRIHGQEVAVKARIERMTGYSGHADQKGLLAWLGAMKQLSGRVYIVHGDPASSATLARLIHESRGFNTCVPAMGEEVDLLAAVPATQPVAVRAVAPAPGLDSHNLYARLMIDLAGFMQRERDEARRQTLLASLGERLRQG